MCDRVKCIHHATTDQGCDYILHMMDDNKEICRRPCPAGKACTEYVPTSKVKKRQWKPSNTQLLGHQVRPLRNYDKRMENYKAGMTDRQMADAENVSVDAIRTWRNRNGLRINASKLGRPPKE